MSGTRSYVILEKEDGLHLIHVNYDSNYLLLYLFLIHNKRIDWEYIIEHGNASFIGTSLTEREYTTKFENHFSRFYNEEQEEEYNNSDYFENFEELCLQLSPENFAFYMDLNDNIYVSSYYYCDDDACDIDYKYSKDSFILIQDFIKEYISSDYLESTKLRISKKIFLGVNGIVECNSEKEREDMINKLKVKYEKSKIFKDDESFNIYIVYETNRPYYEKQY